MDRTRVSPTIDPAPPGAPACRNCGVELTGPYCARCGQEDVPLDRSLRQILRDGLEDFAALDSRLVRTLLTLLFRPGRLTVDYNEGRRVRYVPPLRLYMVASVVFFFVLALMPNFGAYDVGTPDEDESTVGIQFETDGDADAADGGTDAPRPGAADTAGSEAGAAGAEIGAVDDGEDSPGEEANTSAESGFEAWIETQARDVMSDPRGFAIFWIRVLAWSMFVLLPVAALLLMLVYRRPKRYYVQHLVFTLHTHAFAFIVLTAALGIGMLLLPESGVAAAGGDDDALNTPFLVATGLTAIYLYIALVRTYGDGWIRTAVKFCVVGFAYFVAQTIVMMASALVALGLF
ncbi:MAG: DUF3667 domain-containing protein [Gemmatimonadota bacterium]